MDEAAAPALRVDAEESGCGDLMVLLQRSIRKIAPGELLELTARDPGAREDLPSWCRMTGHTLVETPGTAPEVYLVRRKVG
jgi:tRNA 2-thiouridine synthesizing protein A